MFPFLKKISRDRCEDPVLQLTNRKPVSDNDEILYPIMPELYSLPADKIDAEIKAHNSQVRVPIGAAPHLWGQSMYILSRLIMDRLLLPGEIDPLGRRMVGPHYASFSKFSFTFLIPSRVYFRALSLSS